MNIPSQKTIDQYLSRREMGEEEREKVLVAITPVVYRRNQNVVKAEGTQDEVKRDQFLRSVKEYDQIIDQKIEAILGGKEPEVSYDF